MWTKPKPISFATGLHLLSRPISPWMSNIFLDGVQQVDPFWLNFAGGLTGV